MLVKRIEVTLSGMEPQTGFITFDISDEILQSLLKNMGAQNLAQCVICSCNVIGHPENIIPTVSYAVKSDSSNTKRLNYIIQASGLGSTDQATVNLIIMLPHSIIR